MTSSDNIKGLTGPKRAQNPLHQHHQHLFSSDSDAKRLHSIICLKRSILTRNAPGRCVNIVPLMRSFLSAEEDGDSAYIQRENSDID